MVRLKACRSQYSTQGFLVSIPNGTIKRQLRRNYETQNVVSIPNGTIKSQRTEGLLLRRALFQFQMVRLKGGFADRHQGRHEPFQFQMVRLKEAYIQTANTATTFQFQMVRLKADAGQPEHRPYEFQFQMVRLKVKGVDDPFHDITRFNSKWYD